MECHSGDATISNTELVVFRKANAEEARAQFWQRILRDEESASGNHARASRAIEVACAAGAITVARAHPASCEATEPSRPLGGSFWSGAGSRGANLGVECEHQVLARFRAVEYEGNTLTSPAFGNVYCMPRDKDEHQFQRRAFKEHPGPESCPKLEVKACSGAMGPPKARPAILRLRSSPGASVSRSMTPAMHPWQPCRSQGHDL